jgi:pyrroloquinoline quinone (PQQ) biosynthesis protein C
MEPAKAYLMLELRDEDELRAGYAMMNVQNLLQSKNHRSRARVALLQFNDALKPMLNRMVTRMDEKFIEAAVCGGMKRGTK